MVNDFSFPFPRYLLRRNLWSFVLKYCYCRCMPILQYYNLNALQQSESKRREVIIFLVLTYLAYMYLDKQTEIQTDRQTFSTAQHPPPPPPPPPLSSP